MSHMGIKQYLADFDAEREFFLAKGDPGATTLGCSAAVILASALSGTMQADRLAELTGLPINFVGAIVFTMEVLGLWKCERWEILLAHLDHHRENLKLIESALASVVEEIWSEGATQKIASLWDVLELLRGGVVVGGAQEPQLQPEPSMPDYDALCQLWN